MEVSVRSQSELSLRSRLGQCPWPERLPGQRGSVYIQHQFWCNISSLLICLTCVQQVWKQKMCNWENKEHAKEMWDNEENFQCVRWFLTSEQWSEGQFDWQRFWPLTHRQDWHPSVHSDPGCDTNTHVTNTWTYSRDAYICETHRIDQY